MVSVTLITQCLECSFTTIFLAVLLLPLIILNSPRPEAKAVVAALEPAVVTGTLKIITNRPPFVMEVQPPQQEPWPQRPQVMATVPEWLASSLGIIPDPKEVTN